MVHLLEMIMAFAGTDAAAAISRGGGMVEVVGLVLVLLVMGPALVVLLILDLPLWWRCWGWGWWQRW